MRFLFHGTKEEVEAKLSSGGLGKGRCAIGHVYAPARWLPWRAVVTRSGGQAPRPRLENSSVCLKATGAELVLSGWDDDRLRRSVDRVKWEEEHSAEEGGNPGL